MFTTPDIIQQRKQKVNKKNKKFNSGHLIGGVIALVMFICLFYAINSVSSNAKAIYIYNPHSSVLSIKIGNEHYTLNTNESRKVDISLGTYSVKSELNNIIIIDTAIVITPQIMNNGGIINLSGEPLYLWTEYYGGNSNKTLNQIREKDLQFIQIDTTLLYGNIKEYSKNELVIEKEWYYFLDQPFEDEIPADDYLDLTFGKGVAKLFDQKEILDYWNNNYLK